MEFPASHWGRIVWAWFPAVAMMAVIYAASSLANLQGLPGDLSDHSGHFVGYAVLGALMLRGVTAARWEQVSITSALVAFVLAVAYGATDEYHQSFVPGRTPAIDDLVADAAGAGAAIALVTMAAIGLRLERRGV